MHFLGAGMRMPAPSRPQDITWKPGPKHFLLNQFDSYFNMLRQNMGVVNPI